MSVAELICQYCAHRNIGTPAQCGHCGAPLSRSHRLTDAAEQVLHAEQKVVAGAEHVVEKAAAGVERIAAHRYPKWQWRAAIGGVVALLAVLAFAFMNSCSLPMATVGDFGADVDQALPGQLRTAASCRQVDSGTETCVIAADNPMLAGGITGGRELSMTVQRDMSARISQTVSSWRAAGGSVIADGPVFVGIGPSATVRYADSLSGLRIETGAFTGRAGAQTFLTRSGLTH